MSSLSAISDTLHLKDRICVALAAPDVAELERQANAAVTSGSQFLELRLDALADPARGPDAVAELRARLPDATLLATCRTQKGGGGFSGTVDEQLDLLVAAVKAGADLVDVELETLETVSPERLRASRGQAGAAGVVVSAHDFQKVGDLEATLSRLQSFGAPLKPAAYKVVGTATCLADNLRMLAFVSSAARRLPVVGICMGDAGLPSRVLALRSGAAFTFAAAPGSSGTAPGQVDATTMRSRYRVESLGPATQIYGVAGNPVSHSLSPVLHNAGFAAADVDAVYLPLHTVSADDLWTLIESLPLTGLSVTMPWKRELISRLGGAVDGMSARLRAVNTIFRGSDGALSGTNTDVAAVVEPLARMLTLQGARVLVAGAGGAARAAVFGLRERGAEVFLLNRSKDAAERLAAESGSYLADGTRRGGYDAVVNATPAGMAGPLADLLPVDAETLADARVVFEMVYRPAETPLTRLARSMGIPVIAGMEMFLHQGVRQWELWTGRKPPVAAMRAALGTTAG